MQYDSSLTLLNKNYRAKTPLFKKIFAFIFTLIFIFCAALVVFYSIFFQIPVVGPSMKPTYNVLAPDSVVDESSIYKDVAVVNRFNRGTNGDIVIVATDELDSSGNQKFIIKRLIAKEGQTLTLRQNAISSLYYSYYLDGEKIDEWYIADSSAMDQEYFVKFTNHNSAEMSMHDGLVQASITIPEGKIFVLGDNRGHSTDSAERGVYDEERIVGAVAFSYKYNENLIIGIWRALFG